MRRLCRPPFSPPAWLALGLRHPAPPPKTISVTEARLAQMIAAQFPFNSEMLEVLDVVVSTPRITPIRPTTASTPRSTSTSPATTCSVCSPTSATKGALDMSYGLRFEPGTRRCACPTCARTSTRTSTAHRAQCAGRSKTGRAAGAKTAEGLRALQGPPGDLRPPFGDYKPAPSASNRPGCRSRSIR